MFKKLTASTLAVVIIALFYVGINDARASGVSSASNYNPSAVAITGGTITGAIINSGTIGAQSNVSTGGFINLYYTTLRSAVAGNPIVFSSTTPTITSGFGTSPSIVSSNGTATFRVDVGTGGTAFTGTITMPTAANGWNCIIRKHAIMQANCETFMNAATTTSISLTNYNSTTTTSTAWTAGSILVVMCIAY